jgi:hypothetical protein
MQVMEILNQLGGLQSVAKELGVDEGQVKAGAAALMPALLGGFKKQAQTQPSGLDGLVGMLGKLGKLGGGGLLDDVLGPQPTNVGRGNDVLGQIFGSPEVSRTVARNAAATSGVDPALLKKMLPMLAMLVAGFMAKQGMGQPAAPAAGGTGGLGGLGGLLGGLMGQGGGAKSPGLAGMLDLNGDGNPLDDIVGLAGKFLR